VLVSSRTPYTPTWPHRRTPSRGGGILAFAIVCIVSPRAIGVLLGAVSAFAAPA
jgi:hypothetical protein